ncbi:MAG: midasin [Amphiamblys sp. WSBS2006]|nr:MAG: midasin [Amphiamblys sp. WSBS2006]
MGGYVERRETGRAVREVLGACEHAAGKVLGDELRGRWKQIARDARKIQGQRGLTLEFFEGELLRAVREGCWLLLDEINLASEETLEALVSVIEAGSDVVVGEMVGTAPVKKHPDFRLFGCMNPATDVGKRDLPATVRTKFSEFFYSEADDRSELEAIVLFRLKRYAGKEFLSARVCDVYFALRECAGNGALVDGLGRRPHYSLRTLSRALVLADRLYRQPEEKKSVFDGLCVFFCSMLGEESKKSAEKTIRQALGYGGSSARSLFPQKRKNGSDYACVDGVWIKRGKETGGNRVPFIMTPTARKNMQRILEGVAVERYPLLIQGPTSTGKTTAVEYIAGECGHFLVRINNHEHTEISDYLGGYVPDDHDGFVFREGPLVRAARRGDWVLIDELNLAPPDVLEALNRLLDDNRQIFIPETGEVVVPHGDFLLFATQNPAESVYGGRKRLSRAFRNRFIEIHVAEMKQEDVSEILVKKHGVRPRYAGMMAEVYARLVSCRVSETAVFSRTGLVTMRDVFRWAKRAAETPGELAQTGYRAIAEKMRAPKDKEVVRGILRDVVGVEPEERYRAVSGTQLVMTATMRRMCCLVSDCIKHNEPVLLVGETGCGKTKVVEELARAAQRDLSVFSCHQGTETSDFLGCSRPNREEGGGQFAWQDGALVGALRRGSFFLADEISLAEDAVIERLNSVLEPSRTIFVSERGGSLDEQVIRAEEGFQFFGTMNPGNDHGKRELSPALRSRFTEIWIPAITASAEIRQIAEAILPEHPRVWRWIEEFFADTLQKSFSMRDVVSWCEFILRPSPQCLEQAFVHAGLLVFGDTPGIEERVCRIVGEEHGVSAVPAVELDSPERFGIWPFYLPVEDSEAARDSDLFFDFSIGTTRRNVFCLLRSVQLQRATLIEGSPGIGKTAIVEAMGAACKKELVRINLSEHTELADLFGCDAPADGEREFGWHDGAFLAAMKRGAWILLDELNLASQTVLEGLNSCLDHRGSVFIPELHRTFAVSDKCRIFATQNPAVEGGGRKTLPRSFRNRFSRVLFGPYTANEMFALTKRKHPSIDPDVVQRVVLLSEHLRQQTLCGGFSAKGMPFTFNLRDVSRWAELFSEGCTLGESLRTVYGARFRTPEDLSHFGSAVKMFFSSQTESAMGVVVLTQRGEELQCGGATVRCRTSPLFLQTHLREYEGLLHGIRHGWLVSINGPACVGKSSLVKTLALALGHEKRVREVFLTGASDVSDLIGGYEQVDFEVRARRLLQERGVENERVGGDRLLSVLGEAGIDDATISALQGKRRFGWCDGPLIQAAKRGEWLVLRNANLAPNAVLDKMNGLFEGKKRGVCSLCDEGAVFSLHPEFRLFLLNKSSGPELSRALRNRALEIYVGQGEPRARRVSGLCYGKRVWGGLNAKRVWDCVVAAEERGLFWNALEKSVLVREDVGERRVDSDIEDLVLHADGRLFGIPLQNTEELLREFFVFCERSGNEGCCVWRESLLSLAGEGRFREFFGENADRVLAREYTKNGAGESMGEIFASEHCSRQKEGAAVAPRLFSLYEALYKAFFGGQFDLFFKRKARPEKFLDGLEECLEHAKKISKAGLDSKEANLQLGESERVEAMMFFSGVFLDHPPQTLEEAIAAVAEKAESMLVGEKMGLVKEAKALLPQFKKTADSFLLDREDVYRSAALFARASLGLGRSEETDVKELLLQTGLDCLAMIAEDSWVDMDGYYKKKIHEKTFVYDQLSALAVLKKKLGVLFRGTAEYAGQENDTAVMECIRAETAEFERYRCGRSEKKDSAARALREMGSVCEAILQRKENSSEYLRKRISVSVRQLYGTEYRDVAMLYAVPFAFIYLALEEDRGAQWTPFARNRNRRGEMAPVVYDILGGVKRQADFRECLRGSALKWKDRAGTEETIEGLFVCADSVLRRNPSALLERRLRSVAGVSDEAFYPMALIFLKHLLERGKDFEYLEPIAGLAGRYKEAREILDVSGADTENTLDALKGLYRLCVEEEAQKAVLSTLEVVKTKIISKYEDELAAEADRTKQCWGDTLLLVGLFDFEEVDTATLDAFFLGGTVGEFGPRLGLARLVCELSFPGKKTEKLGACLRRISLYEDAVKRVLEEEVTMRRSEIGGSLNTEAGRIAPKAEKALGKLKEFLEMPVSAMLQTKKISPSVFRLSEENECLFFGASVAKLKAFSEEIQGKTESSGEEKKKRLDDILDEIKCETAGKKDTADELETSLSNTAGSSICVCSDIHLSDLFCLKEHAALIGPALSDGDRFYFLLGEKTRSVCNSDGRDVIGKETFGRCLNILDSIHCAAKELRGVLRGGLSNVCEIFSVWKSVSQENFFFAGPETEAALGCSEGLSLFAFETSILREKGLLCSDCAEISRIVGRCSECVSLIRGSLFSVQCGDRTATYGQDCRGVLKECLSGISNLLGRDECCQCRVFLGETEEFLEAVSVLAYGCGEVDGVCACGETGWCFQKTDIESISVLRESFRSFFSASHLGKIEKRLKRKLHRKIFSGERETGEEIEAIREMLGFFIGLCRTGIELATHFSDIVECGFLHEEETEQQDGFGMDSGSGEKNVTNEVEEKDITESKDEPQSEGPEAEEESHVTKEEVAADENETNETDVEEVGSHGEESHGEEKQEKEECSGGSGEEIEVEEMCDEDFEGEEGSDATMSGPEEEIEEEEMEVEEAKISENEMEVDEEDTTAAIDGERETAPSENTKEATEAPAQRQPALHPIEDAGEKDTQGNCLGISEEQDADTERAERGEHEDAEEVDERKIKETELHAQCFPETRRRWEDYEKRHGGAVFELAEMLRITIEPTKATRLTGGYKSGKRLNMRKVIQYVASDYRKDRIWMRRSKKTRREISAVIAIDDSLSMANGTCVDDCCSAMFIIASALEQLESGRTSIVSFGGSVAAHLSFGEALGGESGQRVLDGLSFSQDETDVKKLLVSARSLHEETASEYRLNIIVSDGACHDHCGIRERVESDLESRIVTVFVLIDTKPENESVLNTEHIECRDGEIISTRYLDTFPFSHFIVVRDTRELPSVLSETLRKWFSDVFSVE